MQNVFLINAFIDACILMATWNVFCYCNVVDWAIRECRGDLHQGAGKKDSHRHCQACASPWMSGRLSTRVPQQWDGLTQSALWLLCFRILLLQSDIYQTSVKTYINMTKYFTLCKKWESVSTVWSKSCVKDKYLLSCRSLTLKSSIISWRQPRVMPKKAKASRPTSHDTLSASLVWQGTRLKVTGP